MRGSFEFSDTTAIALIMAAYASSNLAMFSVNTKPPKSPNFGLAEKREHSEEGYDRGAILPG